MIRRTRGGSTGMFLGCKTQLAKVLALAVPWWEPRFQAGVVRFARHVFWIESSMTVRQLVILFLAAGIAWGVPSIREVRGQTLERRLKSFIDDHDGEVAVAVEHLATRERFTHRADVPMPAASLIKFPVMVEVYRQSEKGE